MYLSSFYSPSFILMHNTPKPNMIKGRGGREEGYHLMYLSSFYSPSFILMHNTTKPNMIKGRGEHVSLIGVY